MGLWFPIWKRGGTLYFKSVGGLLRLHYDDGIHIWEATKGRVINPFASIAFNNQLRNVVLKTGINLMSIDWNLGTRIRYAVNDSQGQVSLAARG